MKNSQPLILIIARNEELLILLEKRLHKSLIKATTNGTAGIHMAFELIPDLIISQNILPAKNGIKVCHALKFDIRTKHIPFLLLTKYAVEENFSTGIECDPDLVLLEPYSIDDIQHGVDQLLDIKSKDEEMGEAFIPVNKALRLSLSDKKFVKDINRIVSNHFDNPNFSVDEFAEKMFMSRMQLYRKLKELFDLSPGAFIRQKRILHSAKLLLTTDKRVSQISFESGFSQPAYFAKTFKQVYGCSPIEYRK